MTTATATQELRQRQIEQAEELLFSGPQKAGFAKDLFFGKFRIESIMPYPVLPPTEQAKADQAVGAVREFVEHHLDAVRIDREADIPRETILGLGRVGLMGAAVSAAAAGCAFPLNLRLNHWPRSSR